MFYLWLRLDAGARQRIWRMYGWYCGLMLCACCFGAVAWAAHMMFYASRWKMAFKNVTSSLDEHIRLSTLDSDWTATHLVTFPMEILCSSLAKLIALDRMTEFAVPQGDVMRKRWVWSGRVVIAVVVLGCATMLAANTTAAVYYQKSAKAYQTALLNGAPNDTKEYEEYYSLAVKADAVVINAHPVQQFSEVAVRRALLSQFFCNPLPRC
jgi:hypothetical protein